MPKVPFQMNETPEPSTETHDKPKPKEPKPMRVRIKAGEHVYYGHGFQGQYFFPGDVLTILDAAGFTDRAMEEAPPEEHKKDETKEEKK